jgi:putative transposase
MADHLQRAEPDLLRTMLSTFVQALMSAEADAICGAGYGERSPDRTISRNGDGTRDFDTRTGTMQVAIPKLREGYYFPDWLLQKRRRAERALTTVVATVQRRSGPPVGGPLSLMSLIHVVLLNDVVGVQQRR